MRIKSRYAFTFFLLLGFLQQLKAFEIRCLSVSTGGAVTLSWDRSGLSPADFRSYYIYHSTSSGGPFTAIDSIFIFNDTLHTDNAALAINNPAYYYIVFKSLSGNDLQSLTARAISLNVFNPSNGYANLTWNATADPLIASNSLYYKIYREYPAGFFTLLDSVNAASSAQPMTWSDQISICSDTIKYKIEVRDISGCRSVSNIAGELFRDLQPPVQPVLDSVSLDINGNVILGWDTSSSPDTREYVALQGTLTVDTSFGINNTVMYSSVQAQSSSLSFSVYAVDSCNNPSAPSVPHSTVFLSAAFQLCDKSVFLNWNPYSYWPVPAYYEILVSMNGGPEVLAGTTSEVFFEDTNLVSGAVFCYRVRARESGAGFRSSASNIVCVSPVFPSPPLFSYIRTVSVRGPSLVEVRAHVDATAAVSGYELLRATSPAGPFSSAAYAAAAGSSSLRFFDTAANTGATSYYYKVVSIDSCGLPVFESQLSRSILLTGAAGSDYTNIIEWNEYADWPAGVSRYNLYRKINGIVSSTPYRIFYPGDPFFFMDTVINDFYSDGEFCYLIEAVEAPGNPYFFLDSALSNEVCIQHDPSIFIPNAFRPGGGLNDIFYPSNGFVNTENYIFEIYDRWGQLIFNTYNPRVGWDGSTGGSQAPEGVYIYRLVARKADGSDIELIGSVTLLR